MTTRERSVSRVPMIAFGIALGLLAGAPSPDLTAQGPQSGWRMDGFDPQRTNRSTINGPQQNPTLVTLNTSIVGRLLRTTDDGKLLLLDSDTGTVRAYSAAGSLLWPAPAVVDVGQISPYGRSQIDVAVGPEGNVYVATPISVSAFNPESGAPLWPNPYIGNDRDENSKLAIAGDGTVYFHSGTSTVGGRERLAALTPSGGPIWETDLQERGYARIVLSLDESLIYIAQARSDFGGTHGVISRVSTATGEVIADSACWTSGDAFLVDSTGFVYSTEWGGNGRTISLSPDLTLCSTFPNGSGNPISVSPGIVVQQDSSGLQGLGYDGRLLWTAPGDYQPGPVVDVDGVLYTAKFIQGVGGVVSALDAHDGLPLWSKDIGPEPISGMFLGGDGSLYLTAGPKLLRVSGTPMTGPTLTIDGQQASTRTQLATQPFVYQARGLTSGGSVSEGVVYPDGRTTTTTRQVDASGVLSWSFLPTCDTLPGAYSVSVTDKSSGSTSNTVAATVVVSPCPPSRPVVGTVARGWLFALSKTSLHVGIDYGAALGTSILSVGNGHVRPETTNSASGYGAFPCKGKNGMTVACSKTAANPYPGPLIWVEYTMDNDAPVYVLYGHTAIGWASAGCATFEAASFGCTYTVPASGAAVFRNQALGLTAPYWNELSLGWTSATHLHLGVFVPTRNQKAGQWYGPPTSATGYDSDPTTKTGTWIDPELFLRSYKLK